MCVDFAGSVLSLTSLLATKVGAIVAGQTSVKAPEQEAFEKYLPQDVHIVSCHSLHGPSISPLGQPLVRVFDFFPKILR
jgi:prephenate dehydrogenase